MSDFIKGQAEVRNNLIAQMREVLDDAEKRGGLTAEDSQKIDRLEADIEQRDAAIATAQKVAQRSAEAAEAAGSFAPEVAKKTLLSDNLTLSHKGEESTESEVVERFSKIYNGLSEDEKSEINSYFK